MSHTNSRQVAAEILSEWVEKRRFPDRQLSKVKENHAFVMEVVNGVVRHKEILEWLAKGMFQKKPEPYFEALAFVGYYQLLFMDVEEYAAINETVDAAKGRRGGEGGSRLVNAVLRRTQREKEDILHELSRQPYLNTLHPKFLVDRWDRQFGQVDTKKLLEWNNQPPSTILRVEPLMVDVAEFLSACSDEGIELEPHPFRETFFTVPRGVTVPKIPGFDKGWFVVQDPATSVSVDLLAPRPGETVLDACAAPGGKTAMMAGRMKGEGKIVALDLHDDRIETLKENVNRLKLDMVEVVQGDAIKAGEVLGDRKFDAILLDVPCTNTGVLRRRVDARWRLNTHRLENMAKTQYKILSACAELLSENGRLVYSTCSLEPEENEDLVGRWVRENPGFRRAKAGKAFPPKSETDGAFAALIRRD